MFSGGKTDIFKKHLDKNGHANCKRKRKIKRERMRKSYVKSRTKGRERFRRTSLIRATAFLIYTHTHTRTKTSLIYQLTSALFMGHWGETQKRGREERG